MMHHFWCNSQYIRLGVSERHEHPAEGLLGNTAGAAGGPGSAAAEIAAVLGTTQQVYSRYANGVNELPIRHLITLCRYYRVSADDVLGLKWD